MNNVRIIFVVLIYGITYVNGQHTRKSHNRTVAVPQPTDDDKVRRYIEDTEDLDKNQFITLYRMKKSYRGMPSGRRSLLSNIFGSYIPAYDYKGKCNCTRPDEWFRCECCPGVRVDNKPLCTILKYDPESRIIDLYSKLGEEVKKGDWFTGYDVERKCTSKSIPLPFGKNIAVLATVCAVEDNRVEKSHGFVHDCMSFEAGIREFPFTHMYYFTCTVKVRNLDFVFQEGNNTHDNDETHRG